MTDTSSETLAYEWAQEILQKFEEIVKPQDRPYLEAVLIEAALYEKPMKELSVSMNSLDGHYEIAITGYRQRNSDLKWSRTFLAENSRSDLMAHVVDSYTQMVDNKLVKGIKVKKMEFQSAMPRNAQRSAAYGKRRN